MNKLILLLSLLAFTTQAQVDYSVKKLAPVPLGAVVDIENIQEDFFPVFQYTEAPNPNSTRIKSIKEEVAKRYPRKPDSKLTQRSLVEEPEILIGFESNPRQGLTPPDNSFGISNSGQTVSAINADVMFKDEEGEFLKNTSLHAFSMNLGFNLSKFDPRVIYDPEADRFVIVWLGTNQNNTQSLVYLAFSSGPDVRDDWNVYTITGKPEGDGSWTDYPMISLTEDELFLTVNLINLNQSWQTGFRKTLIYQINKEDGYTGEPLTTSLYSDINFEGKPIRNLHPVKSADENLETDMYFLSNRNFAIENDTIFIVNVSGTQDDPSTEVTIEMRKTDIPYGVPPSAMQPEGATLQTNDARILDAFLLGDAIQFVGNCVVAENGRAGIYHGRVDNLSTTRDVTGIVLGHPSIEFGYPGIAWTGLNDTDDEAILVLPHSSSTIYPSLGAIYMDNDRRYSPLITIKQSESIIDMQQNIADERWGDYSGCQRRYNQPGIVWVNGLFTKTTMRTHTWVAGLSRPIESSVDDINPDYKLTLSPNPTIERILVSMEIDRMDVLNLSLYNMNGQLVKEFLNDKPRKVGILDFSFELTTLPAGTYVFKASLGKDQLVSKKLIKD